MMKSTALKCFCTTSVCISLKQSRSFSTSTDAFSDSGNPELSRGSHCSPYLKSRILPIPSSSRRIDSYFLSSSAVGRLALMERVMSSRASSLNFDILSLSFGSLPSLISTSALYPFYVGAVTRVNAYPVAGIDKEWHHDG